MSEKRPIYVPYALLGKGVLCELSEGAARVILALAARDNEDRYVQLGRLQLCRDTGMRRTQTIDAAIKELEQRSMIAVNRSANHKNQYVILPSTDWVGTPNVATSTVATPNATGSCAKRSHGGAPNVSMGVRETAPDNSNAFNTDANNKNANNRNADSALTGFSASPVGSSVLIAHPGAPIPEVSQPAINSPLRPRDTIT